MRIPKNKIKEGKYTPGGEFIESATNTPYIGYYFEMNGGFFAGKTYDPNAKNLIPKKDQNKLFNNASTGLFSLIAGITSQQLTSPSSTSIPSKTNVYSPRANVDTDVRYFSSKVNQNPTIIKEIDENQFKTLSKSPMYKVSSTGPGISLEEAEAKLPGLKAFLSV
jgi:hypothetical protein